jgi:hypothetical protein
VIEHAFNSSYPTGEEARHDSAVFEVDRTLAAFDGAEMVGTAAAFTLPDRRWRRRPVRIRAVLGAALLGRRDPGRRAAGAAADGHRPGRARPRLLDGLWIRLVSVPGALTARR